MEINEARKRYWWQKSNAATRGIEWKLTFHQWLKWWGNDLDRRGVGHDRLMMCRVADAGAYELGNIYKGYPRDNMKTCGRMKRYRNTMKARASLEAARDASDGLQPEPDTLTEDEHELQYMFGVRSSANFDTFIADKRR